jgi:uncharacterized protein
MSQKSSLKLKLLSDVFGILKLPPTHSFPDWLRSVPVFFVARTEDEFSIMCPQRYIPKGQDYSAGWSCLRVDGNLAFDEVGVASRISRPLADAGMSIFLVSTHDRDYVLIAEKDLQAALSIYESAGIRIANHGNTAAV